MQNEGILHILPVKGGKEDEKTKYCGDYLA